VMKFVGILRAGASPHPCSRLNSPLCGPCAMLSPFQRDWGISWDSSALTASPAWLLRGRGDLAGGGGGGCYCDGHKTIAAGSASPFLALQPLNCTCVQAPPTERGRGRKRRRRDSPLCRRHALRKRLGALPQSYGECRMPWLERNLAGRPPISCRNLGVPRCRCRPSPT
jgi:hypothetical protein